MDKRDPTTLYIGLPVDEAHARQLVQLTCEALLWWLLRVACSHLSHHLQHFLLKADHGVVSRKRVEIQPGIISQPES